MKDHIQFGSKKIEFQLVYVDRKTLGITITPDMEVIVKAPNVTPLDRIKNTVRRKAAWIIKQQGFFLSFHPKTPARKYISGESHLYLGRQYQMHVTAGKKNEVRYKGRFIEVATKDKTKTKTDRKSVV
jgi:predicted metal-dependent hydrolase